MTTPQSTPPDAPHPKTSVILVVKGAGTQKPDETLAAFLNGFWPALKSLEPTATLRQRSDIFPDNFRSSPHVTEPHNHVSEITTPTRRIWIKESYWEQDLRVAGALTGLQREWKMASYAFGSVIYDLVFGWDSRKRNNSLLAFFATYVATYWLVLIWALNYSLDRSFLPVGSSLQQVGFLALIAFALALAASTPLALETRRLKAQNRFTRLPSIAYWVLIFLVAAFVLSPGRYLLGLLAMILVQLVLLGARRLLWPYRQLANSDSDTTDYHSYLGPDGKKRYGRRDLRVMLLSQIFYRYIVVLALPVTFPGLILTRLLTWMGVLGDLADAVEAGINLVFGGVLGDVATYAMDPTLAHQVRCAVESDLQFFHKHPEVEDIHVFAHSQGTPITFEVLFNHLAPEYRAKIKTYVTIGSVLSYYHQANPVLDPLYISRFPVRPYPDDFHSDFKWMNFWNLADPITEFYGLDEYNLLTGAPPLDPKVERHRCSPTNIKTRFTAQNHSEYWSNIKQVQRPFAKRVLGDLRPVEWAPDKLQPIPQSLYQFLLVLLWLLGVTALVVARAGLLWLWEQPLLAGLRYFVDDSGNIVKNLVSQLLPTFAPNLGTVFNWFTSSELGRIHAISVLVVVIAVAALIVISLLWGLGREVRQRLGA